MQSWTLRKTAPFQSSLMALNPTGHLNRAMSLCVCENSNSELNFGHEKEAVEAKSIPTFIADT